VGRQRHQIGVHTIDIKRDFSKGLDRIDMQQPAGGMDDLGHLSDRLQRTGLIIGCHYRHQRRRPAGERRAQPVQIQNTRACDADSADGLGGEPPAREHGSVLDGRNR
jgi:hypothetical protein